MALTRITDLTQTVIDSDNSPKVEVRRNVAVFSRSLDSLTVWAVREFAEALSAAEVSGSAVIKARSSDSGTLNQLTCEWSRLIDQPDESVAPDGE